MHRLERLTNQLEAIAGRRRRTRARRRAEVPHERRDLVDLGCGSDQGNDEQGERPVEVPPEPRPMPYRGDENAEDTQSASEPSSSSCRKTERDDLDEKYPPMLDAQSLPQAHEEAVRERDRHRENGREKRGVLERSLGAHEAESHISDADQPIDPATQSVSEVEMQADIGDRDRCVEGRRCDQCLEHSGAVLDPQGRRQDHEQTDVLDRVRAESIPRRGNVDRTGDAEQACTQPEEQCDLDARRPVAHAPLRPTQRPREDEGQDEHAGSRHQRQAAPRRDRELNGEDSAAHDGYERSAPQIGEKPPHEGREPPHGQSRDWGERRAGDSDRAEKEDSCDDDREWLRSRRGPDGRHHQRDGSSGRRSTVMT